MDPGTAQERVSVFVSYRRRESPHLVGRICDRLVYEFGAANVFRDVESIPGATDFSAVIRHRLRAVDIVLAIIGPAWHQEPLREDSEKPHGDHVDFVYMELRLALELDITVVPVLIDAAMMPEESSLPDAVKGIVRRNAVRIGDEDHFRADCDVLVGAIRSEVAGYRAADAARRQYVAPTATPGPPIAARWPVGPEFSPAGSPMSEQLGGPLPPSSSSDPRRKPVRAIACIAVLIALIAAAIVYATLKDDPSSRTPPSPTPTPTTGLGVTSYRLFTNRPLFTTGDVDARQAAVTGQTTIENFRLRAGDHVYLSGSADGSSGFAIDDFISFNGRDQYPCFPCFGRTIGTHVVGVNIELAVELRPPLDVTSFLPLGDSVLRAEIRDNGGFGGWTDVYLVIVHSG